MYIIIYQYERKEQFHRKTDIRLSSSWCQWGQGQTLQKKKKRTLVPNDNNNNHMNKLLTDTLLPDSGLSLVNVTALSKNLLLVLQSVTGSTGSNGQVSVETVKQEKSDCQQLNFIVNERKKIEKKATYVIPAFFQAADIVIILYVWLGCMKTGWRREKEKKRGKGKKKCMGNLKSP